MVTWVLVEEPTFEVARAIEIVEYRLNSDPEAVQWICAHLPVVALRGVRCYPGGPGAPDGFDAGSTLS